MFQRCLRCVSDAFAAYESQTNIRLAATDIHQRNRKTTWAVPPSRLAEVTMDAIDGTRGLASMATLGHDVNSTARQLTATPSACHHLMPDAAFRYRGPNVTESSILQTLSDQDPDVAVVLGAFSELDRVYHASMQAMGMESLPQRPKVSNTAEASVVLPSGLAS